MSQKTLPPTPRRLREAESQGQLGRSRVLGPGAAALGGLWATLVSLDETAVHLGGWARGLLAGEVAGPAVALREGLVVLARCTAPTLLGAAAGALAAGLVTSGGLRLTPGLVMPRPERLDPVEGLKRLFTLRQAVEVARGLLMAGLVTWALSGTWRETAQVLLRAPVPDGLAAMAAALAALEAPLLRGGAVLVACGLVDLLLARHRHRESLMMSPDEVKQEQRNAEGDPHHKSKRKQLHRQLAAGGPVRGVAGATAVVVNPTHVAVALRYAQAECDAPYIVARGRAGDAADIRREAAALGIPVVRDVPLARTLVQYEPGDAVPEELYQAAAAVLSVALELEREARP